MKTSDWIVAAAPMIGLSLLAAPVYAEPIPSVQIHVIDGDTIRVHHKQPNVRLVGFNAPETRRAECAAERELGDRATRRLRDLVRASNLDFEFAACSCPLGMARRQAGESPREGLWPRRHCVEAQGLCRETFARGCEPKTVPYQLRQESGATSHDAVTIDSRPQRPAHRDIAARFCCDAQCGSFLGRCGRVRPSADGSTHEAAQFHHPARRRGSCLAARGARAAA
jgi:hypothetical protein